MAKEKVKGILINVSNRQQVDMLTDEEAGVLFKAIFAYVDEGIVLSTENRLVALVFSFLRAQIDYVAERYASKCEKNREIAIERERKKQNTNVHERARTCTNVHHNNKKDNNNNKENNKDNKDNNIASKDALVADATQKAENTQLDMEAFREFFNKTMKEYGAAIRPIVSMTKKRQGMVRARMREYGREALAKVVKNAATSRFLNGGGKSGYIAKFNWLFLPENFAKVLERDYNDDETPAAAPTTEIIGVQDEDGNTEIVEIEHKPIVRRTGEITATLEDVTMLFAQLGYDVNFAQPFYDYYASQGWRKANGQKITRLDTLIRAWMEREREIQLERLTKKEKELNYADAGYEERTQRFLDSCYGILASRKRVPEDMESDETADILPF